MCTCTRIVHVHCMHEYFVASIPVFTVGYNLFMRIVFASPACSYKDELYAKHEGTSDVIHLTSQ